jgi:hypothetical protein
MKKCKKGVKINIEDNIKSFFSPNLILLGWPGVLHFAGLSYFLKICLALIFVACAALLFDIFTHIWICPHFGLFPFLRALK